MLILNTIREAREQFENLLKKQLKRAEFIKNSKKINLKELDKIKIGFISGDGIGSIIINEAKKVLEFILREEIKKGLIEFINIEGLTIENRVKEKKALPLEVLKKIKECHVLLKGPTTTPKKGDPWPNIESANVALRKELDLFANIRPVKIPQEGIDWIFFRENTEGAYALGNEGFELKDIAMDFKVTTIEGSERILRMAFDYAMNNNNKQSVTVVTKSNIIKATDGKFLEVAEKISKDYKDIKLDHWFVDIFSAKLLDKKRRTHFGVIVLPNLYGDIITDEAAELQGGVGTAGSSNIGNRYAIFEAIHGSALRMVEEKREKFANPLSILRASIMLLNYINFKNQADKLEEILDQIIEKKEIVITGDSSGATCSEFGEYILKKLKELK